MPDASASVNIPAPKNQFASEELHGTQAVMTPRVAVTHGAEDRRASTYKVDHCGCKRLLAASCPLIS